MTLYVQTTNELLEKILQEQITQTRLLTEIKEAVETTGFGPNAHALLEQIANK